MVKLYIKLCQFLGTSCFADCCYIVVQAGLGFDIDTGTALYLTVAAEAAVEVIAEITTEIAAEVLTEVITEIFIIRLDQGVRNFVYYYMVV